MRMPRRLSKPIEETCQLCGRTFMRYHRGRRKRCASCGLVNQIDTARQLYEGRGPAYDKWLKNIAASVAKIAAEQEEE